MGVNLKSPKFMYLFFILYNLISVWTVIGVRDVQKIVVPQVIDEENVALQNKRSVDHRTKACEMLISFDEPFWENKDRNMTELVNIAKKHVQKLNDVFTEQIFINEYSDLYFKLARVQVGHK